MSARRSRFAPFGVGLCAAVVLGACVGEPDARPPTPERAPTGVRVDELGSSIVVGGEHVWIGAPVVLWFDPGGYNAYSRELRFPGERPSDPEWEAPDELRYKPGRSTPDGEVSRRSSIEAIGQVVDQFVLHYDACGLSRTCFKVLHDRRELSVHFLLDVDGTLYQTLDLAETAWHARQANGRSIGIEIANIGAYAPGSGSPLDTWYERDAAGARLVLPPEPTGVRTPAFEGRPARPRRIRGTANGRDLEMYDLTPEQYDSLARLTAALCRVFPRIRPDAPRDAEGRVRTDVLSDEAFRAFHGILGHHHVSASKYDPGPAFDWERYLTLVRSALQPLR